MLSTFSVKKPYTVVVGVVLVIILGVVSFGNMTVDLLPSMNLPYAVVMTTYMGASPEEVEQIVTRPVEQTMATVSNIKTVQSVSNENASTVVLEFEQTANMDSVTIEMRENLDQIRSFWPDEVSNPIIIKLNPDMMPVLVAAVSAKGEDAAAVSKTIEEQVIPEVESVEGVASVTVAGSIEETVEILVNEQQVTEFNDKVKAELEKKTKEAKDALQEAKAKAESGRSALEAGKAQASAGLAQAEAQMSVKSEELKQAQLEITEKMAELNVSETQLKENLALIQAGKAPLEAQLAQLDAAKAKYDELQGTLALPDLGITEEQRAELEAQLAELGTIVGDGVYEGTRETLTAALQQLEQQEAALKEGQNQLLAGKSQLEAVQRQVNEGAMTLAQARGQLASAQLEAAVGIGEGTAKLAAGESALQMQEAQMESAMENASAGAEKILTADMVKTILLAENFSMPAGYVEEEGIRYLVRVGEKFRNIGELKDLILINMEGLDPVRLSDVASVKLVNNSDETYSKINGNTGLMLTVQKQTGYSTGDVSDRVLERLEQVKKGNPDIDTVILMDQGVYIDMIVNSVLQNLVYGAVLAIIILLVFLKSLRPTFVIACSIPISIMTALVAMYFSGVTLNIISLSGLALGVGMLVDNSIVVIENIYRMRNEEGASARKAAIEGARQVSGAIAASTLTTVCVFLPIVFTSGVTRQLFVDMGLTIAYSLLASLAVAVTLVPMMSAGLLKKTENKESRVFAEIKEGYGRALRAALNHKILVLAGTLLLFVGSIALELTRGTQFMPDMESTQIRLTLEPEKGTSLEDAAKVADEVMERIGRLADIVDIGGLVSSSSMVNVGGRTDSSSISFYATTKENPSMTNEQLKKEIERVTEDLDGERTVKMSNMDMSALGSSGINIQIKGKDLDRLQEIAKDIKKLVEGVKGTQNVSDGTEDNQEELRVVVDKAKAVRHGLTVAQVYQELSGKLSEAKKATVLSTDTNEYDIYVLDDAKESMGREDVRGMTVTAQKQDGTTEEVKLADIAAFEDASGLTAISRMDQSRYMSVTAEIQDGDNIGLVSSRVKKALGSYQAPEGYEIKMTGEDETIREAMIELFKMLALALVFMYLIMVAQFQSLRSPFIVMFTVPLAFTGGLLALFAAGKPVSVIAMIGFVMLSGIIVNNGIVLIDYANQLIESGMEQREALVEAGTTRLRPIIMTALTTILGLSTMAAGVGMGADMVQPMAIVTIGGLIYGTVLTLAVVPCIFNLFHKKEKAGLRERIEEEEDLADEWC